MLCEDRVNDFDVDYSAEKLMVPAISHKYSLREKSINSYTMVLRENDYENQYDFDQYTDAYEVFEASAVYGQASTQKKRKRKPLPTRPHIPRILKHDFRRDFGAMFTNVFNSADYAIMTSFINRYHRSDHEYRMILQGQDDPIVVINGHTQMANYWYERMYDAPDILFRMDQSQLTVSSNGTSVFSSEFNINGTRVEVNGQNVQQILAMQALQRELQQQQQSAQQREKHALIIRPQEFTNCVVLESSGPAAAVNDDSSSCSSNINDPNNDTLMGFPTIPPQAQGQAQAQAVDSKECPFFYNHHKQEDAEQAGNSFFPMYSITACEEPPEIQLKEFRVQGKVSIFLDATCMCERIEFIIYPDMERYEEMKARLMLIRARHNPDRIR